MKSATASAAPAAYDANGTDDDAETVAESSQDAAIAETHQLVDPAATWVRDAASDVGVPPSDLLKTQFDAKRDGAASSSCLTFGRCFKYAVVRAALTPDYRAACVDLPAGMPILVWDGPRPWELAAQRLKNISGISGGVSPETLAHSDPMVRDLLFRYTDAEATGCVDALTAGMSTASAENTDHHPASSKLDAFESKHAMVDLIGLGGAIARAARDARAAILTLPPEDRRISSFSDGLLAFAIPRSNVLKRKRSLESDGRTLPGKSDEPAHVLAPPPSEHKMTDSAPPPATLVAPISSIAPESLGVAQLTEPPSSSLSPFFTSHSGNQVTPRRTPLQRAAGVNISSSSSASAELVPCRTSDFPRSAPSPVAPIPQRRRENTGDAGIYAASILPSAAAPFIPATLPVPSQSSSDAAPEDAVDAVDPSIVANPPNDVVEAWSIVAADAAAMYKTEEVAAASDTFIIRGDRERRKGRRPESIARNESEPAPSTDIECSLAQDEYENEADLVDAQHVSGTTSELPPPKTRVDFQMGSSCHVAATGVNIPPVVQWVQCDECKKWRRVSNAVFGRAAGDSVWTCPDNYADDPLRGSCDAPEEVFEENRATEAAVEVISSCDDGEDDRWTTTARPWPAISASSPLGATTRASKKQVLKRARRDY